MRRILVVSILAVVALTMPAWVSAAIKITKIQYDAPGSDTGSNINQEYVVIMVSPPFSHTGCISPANTMKSISTAAPNHRRATAPMGGVMEEPIWTSPWHVYFIVSSKEDNATISVEHPLARQTLTLPVHPSDAVPEALPLLEPGFAHYVAQWDKIMVPDPKEADARGFYLTPADVPDRIADPANAPALSEIATRHLSPEMKKFFEGMLPVPALSGLDLKTLMLSNTEEVCDPPERFGIEP